MKTVLAILVIFMCLMFMAGMLGLIDGKGFVNQPSQSRQDDDKVVYQGTLTSAVHANGKQEGWQVTFEDGKTVFVKSDLGTQVALYQEGFVINRVYTIRLTEAGSPYLQLVR